MSKIPLKRVFLTLNMLQTLIYKKASGKQYLDVVRILVPPQVLVPLAISVKLGGEGALLMFS